MLRIHLALLLSVGTATFTQAADWPMLYGSPHRNNVSPARGLPVDFDVVKNVNIKWKMPLGSQSYGNPIVSDGQIYVGTNNGSGYLRRFPRIVDIGCLLCFRESDGEFQWQYSAPKLKTGRVHDWPLQGICSSPFVEGDRMWFVSNRGEVVCLDTKGYYDGEDDGYPGEFSTSSILFTAINDLSPKAIPENEELKELRLSTLETIVRSHTSQIYGRLDKQINLNDHSWVIQLPRTPTQTLEQRLYTLRFTDDRFFISHNPSPGRTNSTTYPLKITEGLERSQLSGALIDLFAAQGVKVPQRPILETLKKGHRWRLRGVKQETEIEYELRLEKNLLTCEVARNADERLREADVVWSYDMMGRLNVSQHNMATCSPLVYGDLLFLCTSNGLDETHLNLPSPNAPSFIALNKNSGELIWADNSPGTNILHGQWSCPAIGEFDGVPQVIFPGGDGWIYSFQADDWKDGKPILLWKFDANPKESRWVLGGSGTRNNVIAPPTIYDGKVYIVVGQDPEHGEGPGHLWCIDPTKRGDISAELAVDKTGRVLPLRRLQAFDATKGEAAVPNPNSGVIWHLDEQDVNGDGKLAYEEEMHRAIASPVIKDGLLYQADFSGILYCIDAFTGKIHWTHDQFSPAWGTPLIADGKVYVGDEDGDLTIFRHSRKKEMLNEIYMESSIKMTSVAIGRTLYVGTLDTLYAISLEE